MKATADEIVICLLARMLTDAGVVGVGSSSPIPAAGALLAQSLCPGGTRALIFRNNVNDPFHESGSELYDRISQGRIDVFFIGGGQIDGSANLNNVGVGVYPRSTLRFPGSFGTPYIISMVPRVILYREEHSPRVLVRRVDFISAAGLTPPHVHRRGGPMDLVTSKARFTFDARVGRFTLASVHPGHTAAEIREATGFDYDQAEAMAFTALPTEAMLNALRGIVRKQVAETYPEFASMRLQAAG